MLWLVTWAYASETAHAAIVETDVPERAPALAAELYTKPGSGAYDAVLEEAKVLPAVPGLLAEIHAPY